MLSGRLPPAVRFACWSSTFRQALDSHRSPFARQRRWHAPCNKAMTAACRGVTMKRLLRVQNWGAPLSSSPARRRLEPDPPLRGPSAGGLITLLSLLALGAVVSAVAFLVLRTSPTASELTAYVEPAGTSIPAPEQPLSPPTVIPTVAPDRSAKEFDGHTQAIAVLPTVAAPRQLPTEPPQPTPTPRAVVLPTVIPLLFPHQPQPGRPPSFYPPSRLTRSRRRTSYQPQWRRSRLNRWRSRRRQHRQSDLPSRAPSSPPRFLSRTSIWNAPALCRQIAVAKVPIVLARRPSTRRRCRLGYLRRNWPPSR